jgi:hypothetical protein
MECETKKCIEEEELKRRTIIKSHYTETKVLLHTYHTNLIILVANKILYAEEMLNNYMKSDAFKIQLNIKGPNESTQQR